jgi:peptidoglycan L-alanyl-D-glutamate endopeptidase CwlK
MSRDINLLHPELQSIIIKFKEMCKKQGLNVTITETYRTVAEQEAVYNKGKSKARGTEYQSGHQWGVAFDICQATKDSKQWYNKDFLKRCGAIGKTLGLYWGGDFRSFPDSPHFEMKAYMTNNSTKTLKAKHGTPEAFIKTWKGTHSHKVSTPKPVATKQPATQQYPTLRQGDTGESVKQLQQLLNNNGAKLIADGAYGAKTTAAVKAYQKAKKLTVDGIAGSKTIQSLIGTK